MPSTAAHAIMRSAKLAAVELHHLSAHCAFCWTQGTVSIARRSIFFVGSLTYVSMRKQVPLAVDVFEGNLEAVEASGFQ
jgi:hypothetical protein